MDTTNLTDLPDIAETQISEDNRRIARRLPVDSLAIINSNQRSRTTRLVNISAGGALVGPLFGIDVGDRATLDLPGYGPITGWVARMTDDNYAAICFSPDPDFHQLCEEQGDELLETIRGAQMAFRNPFTAKNEMTL